MIMTFFYRSLFPVLFFLFLFLGYPFSAKIREGFRLRRLRLRAPYLKKLEQSFWIHAASGEYEYARPIVKELKTKFPHIPIVVTFFSPTYLPVIEKDPLVDFAVPLPFDFPGALRSFIRKISPRALFIARTDLWPEMIEQCRCLGIPRVLFSYHQSKAKGFLSKGLRRWLLNRLSHVDCVNSSTAEWVRGQCSVSVSSFGDTRFDRVQERKQNPRSLPFQIAKKRVFVLGSTWAEDEAQLFPALCAARDVLDLIVIAPHEPTAAHVASLQARLSALGFEWQLFSEATALSKQVLILDRVGYLFEFYRFSDLAFVGNSFRAAVHSVMEPLAFGNRVLVGPMIQNNGEALEFTGLVSEGLPAVQVCKDSSDLEAAILKHFKSPEALRAKRQGVIAGEALKRSGASGRLLKHLQDSRELPETSS